MTGLLARYGAFAIDLDGVVWRGTHMIDGAIEALSKIDASGKPYLLLTNNATYSPSSVAKRLGEAGLRVDPERVISTSTVARRWIADHDLVGAGSMLIAPPEVASQLEDLVRRVPADASGATEARIVLVARDTTFDFAKLDAASEAVRRGAVFLAVNRDPVLPVEDGLKPGTGAIVAAIQAASGIEPIVLGKPERPMMSMALEVLGAVSVVMIGDRIGSDIVGGRSNGWDTALVMSGVTSSASGYDVQPDHILGSLLDVTK